MRKTFKSVKIQDEAPEEKTIIADINEKKIEVRNALPADKEVVKDEKSTLPDFAALIQQGIKDAVQKLEEEKKAEMERLRQEFEGKVSERTAAMLQEVTEKLQTTQSELEKTKEAEQKLADLFKFTGSAIPTTEKGFPNVNTVTTIDSDKPVGTVKEFLDIYDSAPKKLKMTAQGSAYWCANTIELDKYARKNRTQLMRDTEAWARKNGYLRGNDVQIVREAATVAADIVGGFLSTLSSLMRTTHRPRFVFWQFPNTQIQFTQGIGDTIKVPRSAYQVGSTTLADYKLSGGGSYSAIQTTNQALATGTVDIVLEEYGLGKTGTALYPISIPTFVMAQSMIDLMNILELNLGYSYAEFLDRKIRSLWTPTSRIVYNDKKVVTTTATNVDTGDNGTFQKDFLINLFAYMGVLQVETFPDGCYGLVTHPIAISQLKTELSTFWTPPTPQDLINFTNMFNPTTIAPEDTAMVSGYQGKFFNFHLFETNAFATGVAGTEGVRNTTLGSGPGSTLTRTSYAFGRDTIALAVGEPMEIRKNDFTDYQRKDDYIWRAVLGTGPLDVDPTGYSDTSAVPQQLRVIDIRTTDAAV